MAISNRKAVLKCDLKKVWDTVTSLKEYTWRSELGKIVITGEKQFTEYTAKGYATTFTITAEEPYNRWEFDMENDNMKGHWSGLFTRHGDCTEVDFTENVVAKKLFMRPFIKSYLRKQQTQYITDLEKVLSE